VPVDYAGQPCAITRINEIADKHGLYVIQDAAQSCGSRFQGKLTGTQAKITCFSFHATKNLVTGEGGCMVTDDDAIAEKAYIIRDKGTDKHQFLTEARKIGYFEYQALGNSYVQSDILGALALSQLKKLEWMNQQRRAHAEYLNQGLAGIKGIELPYCPEDTQTNWHLYAIRVANNKLLEFREALNKEGVECNTHYNPLHINALYRSLGYQEEDFPEANRVYQTLLRLPMYPQLSRDDLDYIIAGVRKAAKICL
jgi:dTDP-4-amino-4,6-dideoxygalactose transaminase